MEERQEYYQAPYKWLSEQHLRVFVVQFVLPGDVNHTVRVDFSRRVVWLNAEEDYSVELNDESLRLCCGGR